MEADRKLWPVVVIRIFAVTNLLMGLVGVVGLWAFLRTRLHYDPWPQNPPFLAQAYYTRSGINVVFVVLTLVAAVYLWRLGRRGWTLCKVLFVGQIVYFLIDIFCFPLSSLVGHRASAVDMAVGGSAGTGEMGIGIQTITGYPVIALIALKIAYGRLLRGTTPAAGATPPSPPA